MSQPATHPAPAVDTETFDARARANSRLGDPADRSRSAGLTPRPMADGAQVGEVLVWIDQHTGRTAWAPRGEARAAGRVSVKLLDQWLTGEARMVAAEGSVVRRLVAATGKVASRPGADQDMAGMVLRRLQLASHLRYSAWVAVLTGALARRYWMPAGLDIGSLTDWGAAFGHGSEGGPRAMDHLAALSEHGGHIGAGKYAHDAARTETRALEAGGYPGMRASVAAFHQISTTESLLGAWDLTDRGLHQRHLLTGQVSALADFRTGMEGFSATVSQPTRVKAGRQVLVMDNVSAQFSATVKTLEVQGTALVATLTWDSRRDAPKGRAMLTHEAASARPVYVSEAPFVGGRRAAGVTRDHRWTKGNGHSRVRNGWQMPVEVAVAAGGRT